MRGERPSCSGPVRVSRRGMLQLGAAGYLGLSLPSLLRADEQRSHELHTARADHCILIFLNGGPSHLDMWDMKPAAPVEIRGEFQPIATSVPGVQFGEHLPRLARHMHRCTLVRSVHHSVNNAHAAAVYTGLTGHDRGDANIAIGASPNDYPAIGAVVGMLRPPNVGGTLRVPSAHNGTRSVPATLPTAASVVPFVSMPYITEEGRGGPPQPGFFGGWLGRGLDPLFVLRDPNAADFAMPELSLGAGVTQERMQERRLLGTRLSELRATRELQEMNAFQARAFDLLTSPATQRAFQIQREPLATRERYGRNIYGQSVLLARRLIEAGTRVATISWAPDANATWDTHSGNFTKLKTELLPQLDMAVSSLLEDLATRGLLERTVVAVMGEFGRTPRVNNSQGGRDHWNFCYSLLLAGGGLRGGFVYGASDRIGARPSLNPVFPADIIATIYHCLGIPADYELRDRLNRPFTLVPWGSPIMELLA
ncbi:MAG: DUF1501 domain-containing protein [Gemmataceae bacterium]|nr:DUF1501 domain-containing protein [Gemmataceae bacterium]MCI0741339.1 DUF1501 domain-containing protein [Gemmataceae bacterium]